MSLSTRNPSDTGERVTLGKPPVDPRVLTKEQVRFMLQTFHPDRYKGDNPEAALRMFIFFRDYEGV